ncbi:MULTISPECIES: carbohydrate ABC transporter permease [Paenibacillus]|uniref:ABC transmembrane type-1 domain-containing protein n=1 Tax=Paenibacillus odorifer TaxID=189426 RepID=A0ABX3HN58_9BACL|nr:carbohydrate ABC transporter permease [Paenibacillus odorifer]OMD52200.1 hypothetical protein BSK51_12585 [Paenibacillus odorifer]
MKGNTEDKVINIVLFILMSIVTLVTLYPLYYSFIISLNDANDIAEKGFIYLSPRKFTLENFKIVFTESKLAHSFLITGARTILGTIASVLFTACVSYPLSKKYLALRSFYIRTGVITMYFFGGIIPTYLLLNSLGLIDTFLVYIIPSLYSFFNAILFINFFSSIPDALEESAKIDGANDWRVFWKITLPLSAPILATVSLFYGVQQWNSWFDAAYYTNSPDLATLQLVLYQIISQSEGAAIAANYLGAGKQNINIIDSMKYATMVVSVVPVALAYPFLQKYFVQGMMVGSVKG